MVLWKDNEEIYIVLTIKRVLSSDEVAVIKYICVKYFFALFDTIKLRRRVKERVISEFDDFGSLAS